MQSPEPELRATSVDTLAVASYGQQRLWVTQQVDGRASDYNTPHFWELRGPLDTVALGRAFSQVIARHQVLRTRFELDDSTLYQRIDAPTAITIPVYNVPEHGGRLGDNLALVRRLRADYERPFDLARGPLFRVALYRLGDEHHVLSFVVHHIVSDGWSMGLLQREWSEAYARLLQAQPATAAPLPLQYSDFAIWQRSMFEGGHWRAQLDYWRSRLAGLKATELPSDRGAAGLHGAGNFAFRIPRELRDALQVQAQRLNMTPFMVMLAALGVLLQRHGGSNDVAIGTSVAGRNRAETSELIGFFVNQLVLRTDLNGDPTVEELLQRARATVLDALDHQDIPFSQLVAELPHARGAGRTPFFQLLVVLQDFPEEPLKLPGLQAERWVDDRPAAKFDVSLYLGTDGDGMSANWVYDRARFTSATIERLARHLLTLLANIAEQPAVRISELRMWDADELAARDAEREQRKANKFDRLRAMAGDS
jgi:hypothetical protein